MMSKNYYGLPVRVVLNISKAWKELLTKGPEATALKPISSPIVLYSSNSSGGTNRATGKRS
jgi:hypothetical protein